VADYSIAAVPCANESGALNEAFSDIMGTAVRPTINSPAPAARRLRRRQRRGDARRHPVDGEPAGPRRSGPLATASGAPTTAGVHQLHHRPHAYYLRSKGHESHVRLSVQGKGRQPRWKTFYRAFTQLCPRARRSPRPARHHSRGPGSLERTAPLNAPPGQAWTAVGVN
jgi:hypothetical protein